MRIAAVIDTNVFVSALLRPSGSPRQIIRHCLQGAIEPLMGVALFSEYEAVMARPAIFTRSVLDETERYALLDAFFSVCRWVSVYYLWRPNLPDENDNHLIELATAGNAEAIVTGNTKDFRKAELLFPHIKIITPTEFLQQRSN